MSSLRPIVMSGKLDILRVFLKFQGPSGNRKSTILKKFFAAVERGELIEFATFW